MRFLPVAEIKSNLFLHQNDLAQKFYYQYQETNSILDLSITLQFTFNAAIKNVWGYMCIVFLS
jgi:hypothetical protein